MNSLDDLHQHAMDIAEEAFYFKRRGAMAEAKHLFAQALSLERRAAELLPASEENEPSRSILFRSAASLAYNADDFASADRLITLGLAGFPPKEVRDELWALYEDIRFAGHLQSHQMELDPHQFVLSLNGAGVASGVAPADQVMTRVERLRTVVYRTAERLLAVPYRLTGGVSKEFKNRYELFFVSWSPGSFSVSFQVGRPLEQLALFGDEAQHTEPVEPNAVINEVIDCLRLFEFDRDAELSARIPDDLYRENFIGLAKEIAPDGNTVQSVGLISYGSNESPPLVLKRNRKQLRAAVSSPGSSVQVTDATEEIYRGTLFYANTPLDLNRKTGQVKLLESESKKKMTINVPIALMKDVVQPYYGEVVVVSVREEKGRMILIDLSLDDTPSERFGE